jgi:hypothetical protein
MDQEAPAASPERQSVPHMKFDDVLGKILASPPEPKSEHKKAQPMPRKQTSKKR